MEMKNILHKAPSKAMTIYRICISPVYGSGIVIEVRK